MERTFMSYRVLKQIGESFSLPDGVISANFRFIASGDAIVLEICYVTETSDRKGQRVISNNELN